MILFFSTAGVLFAQRMQENFPVVTSETKHLLRIYGEGYYDSQDISNEFTSKFFKGGYIDTTLKNKIYGDLKDENNLGAEVNTGLQYFNFKSSFFGKPHWGWAFGISNNEYYNAAFSKNLFGLTFFGNKQFAGDTVNLGPAEFNQLRFQKLQFGIFNKENFSQIFVSLVKAEDFFQMNLHSAKLYTESNGNEIALDLSENMARSDTNSNGLLAYNGLGIATDFVINLNSGKNRSAIFDNSFRITFENVGFIHWNENTLYHESDSNYLYEGFEVENILDENNSIMTGQTAGDTVSINYEKGNRTIPLPFTFSFAKTIDLNAESKLQSFYGIRFRAFCNYKPLVYAGLAYCPSKKMAVSPYVSFGGYGSFKAGLQFETMITKYFKLAVSSSNVVGDISENGYGKDLAITIYSFF